MKVEYAEETSVRKSLQFEIESEVVESELELRAKEYGKKAKLPGFRAGKVPSAVIRKRFRDQIFEDATEVIVNRVVFPELEGRGLRPVATPRVTELKIDDQAPMTFKVVFEVLPLIELPEWRGLPARSRRPQVTEEQVDQELNGLREQHARFDPLEARALQAGDHAVVDVLWRPLEGGRGGRDENALIEVGGETNSALREALSGMSPGETKQVNYTPQAPEGESPKPIHYTLTVKAVKHKIVPAADDDFAKDLGEFETLQELRDDIRKRLDGAERQRIDRELKRQLLSELCKRASFELPEALVERHMTTRTEQAARTLAMQGVDPSKVGIDWKQYREAQRAEASEAAKGELLLDELARREGLEVSDAELEAELARYARALRRPLEALRAQMEKNGELHGLRARLRDERSLDLIKADARLEFE